MGSCCRKQVDVAQQVHDYELNGGSLERLPVKKGTKRRPPRRSPDSSDDDSSENETPRYSATPTRKKPGRKPTPTDPFIVGDARFAQDKGRLQQIADDMLAYPPQPLLHSKSYNHSKSEYDKKFGAARTEEYLDCVYEGEVEKLQNTALVKPLKSTKRKMPAADNEETTRHTQLSEYRLQMGALVNSYMERRQELQNIRYEEERQRNEDLIFLENLRARIKTDKLPHTDVVRHLSDYTTASF